MDYDDNDFQGQNLQLAGEESSKLSPVLLPYALPKFDFDDGLQGHLRFDSLVENEVFLGIPSQEDNQWIEDFSQGSSGIEFSSSAAESCSISRRNNVWSEATSSESVEMLLKSVGQEEMVPGETIIEESDACDELGGLSEQMEPHLKQDDKVNNVMDSEPALPSDEFLEHEHFSRSNVVEGSSQIQEAEVSTHGSSHELDPNASIETCGIIVAENNPGVDRKCDDANQTEVDTSINESLDNKMQKDSSGSGIEIDAIDSSSQDIAARIPLCLTPEPEHQASDVSFENANSLFKDTGKAVEEHHVLNKEADADNQNSMRIAVESGTHYLENQPCSSSNAVSIGQHAIDTDISNFEEPSSLPLKGDGNLQIAEGCSEDLCSTNPEKASKCESVVSSNSTEIHSQFSRNMNENLPVVCDSNLEGHASGDSNMKAGIRASSELQIDQTTDGENSSVVGKAYVRGSDHQLDSEASVPNSETSLLTGVENKLFDGQGDGSHGNYVGDLLSLTVEYSSTELLGEKHTVENLKGMDNASGVHKEDLNAEDHASSHVVAVSMLTYRGNVVSNPNDEHYNKNVAFNENENSKLPNDSICMNCEIVESRTSDKRVEPFPEEGMEINNEVVHGSECVTTSRNEPASNVTFGKKNFASHVDGATLLSETGATFDQVTDHLDKTKRTEDEGPIETNLLSLMDGSEGASELGPLLELEKGASPSSAWKLSHKPVDQSLSTLETCNSASMSEQSVKLLHMTIDQSLPMDETSNTASRSEEAVKANEISQNSSNKLEVCPIGDSAVKEGGDAEGLLVAENHEDAAVEKKHEVASSKVANAVPVANKGEVLTEPTFITLSEFRSNMGQNDHERNEAVMESRVSDCGKTPPSRKDSVKPNCGTPPVISCTVLSQSEDKKEGVEDSVATRVSFSEVSAHSTSQNVSGNDAAKDDRSFTFEIHPSAGLSERESSKDGQSMTTIQACKIPIIVEGSSSTPSIGQIDSKMVSELSHGSLQAPVGVTARGGSKGTPERKTRRASVRATGKENAKKGNHVKGTTPVRQAERRDKSCSMSVSLAGTGQIVQLEGLKPYGNVERGTMPCVIAIPTSNLPDLNTSAPPSALFQQPFTDLQQVQLRAQIFVYGSLIQGAAPDEACMVSAFGASDGGRSVWEPGWRTCAERIQGQKSHPNKSQIPVQPRSGDRTPDQSIKQGAHQSKVVPSPLGRASSRGTPSPVVNSMIPLSSPLWNISTPSDGLHSSGMPRSSLLDYHQALPPLHPFQNTPTRSFVGPTASWLSQAPFPGPWVASPQTSAFDASVRFSMLPLTETVKLTPVKESSPPVSSGTKHASPSTMVHTTGPSVLAGTSSLPDMKKMTVVPGQHSTDLKARKRKKVTVSEDLGQMSLLAQTQTGSVSAPVVSSHLSTTVVISTPSCFASKGNASKIVTAVSPMSSTDQPKRGGHNEGQKVVISEETLGKVEEAKQQAEDAAALAAAAVSHSQSVWSRLDKQKNSGLIPDVESKLASAAVAIAAAASVAKAAAAAAKIASNAALQAKLMADEALTSGGTSNPAQSNAASLPDVVNNLGKATPASNLKGGDGSNCSSSIIVAAREAARRRVEAASAASKHAENLDAIVKAAELAAEAVSQAGKIVAMGDPLLLKELVENGPEGYWRVPQFPSEQGVILSTNNRERSKVDSIEGLNDPSRHAEDGPSQEAKTTNHCLSSLSSEVSRGSMADHMRVVDGISSSFTISEMDSRGQRSRRASDLAKTIGVPESEIESRSVSISPQDECEKRVGTLKENNIKEGCLVEVRKDGDEFKTAWFSANVLSLKDGKAFVCYTELQSDKGTGKLKEWVALEGEANNAPRIRIAYPTTTMRFEGTRKRRRAAMGDYVWSVGDRVDVWLQDCWREGVVSEKNKKDDSTLTVHFPVEGETSVVKVWHLRPTLIWKDGEWIECSGSKVKDPSPQDDTPQEKRLKLGIPAIEDREMDKMSKNIELVESGKPDGSRLLPLSANEKLFNVGKNIVDENKPNALRTIRSGLQKEGSRVIIGVPKPGKKRKFMEVSKHYVAERSSKTNESNDSVKFAKYLMPLGSGSRGWKNNNKTDAKEKQAAESKTKVLKSGKPPNVPGKTLPQKDKFLASALSAPNDGTPRDSMIKDSVSTDVNESGQQSLMEFGSFSNTDVAAEGPVLFSSLALPSDVPSKKISTSNAKTEQVNRGKFATSGGRLVRVEVKDNLNNGNPGNSIPDVAEPRRSNRRIQPTSRLLEGLQSSLIISKIPAVPHDKSRGSQNRGTSKGNNHG